MSAQFGVKQLVLSAPAGYLAVNIAVLRQPLEEHRVGDEGELTH